MKREDHVAPDFVEDCDCVHMIGRNERGGQMCGNAYCPNGDICIYTSLGGQERCDEYMGPIEIGETEWEKFYIATVEMIIEHNTDFPLDEFIRNEIHNVLIWYKDNKHTMGETNIVLDKLMGLVNAIRCLDMRDVLAEMEEKL